MALNLTSAPVAPADELSDPWRAPRRGPASGSRRRGFAVLVVGNLAVLALVLRHEELIALALAALVPVIALLIRRPQFGVVLIVGLVPYDGLLILLHSHSSTVRSWKEALVLLTLLATFVAPAEARSQRRRRHPRWVVPLVGLMVIGILSASQSGLSAGISGFRIDFFYVLLAIAVWRCPLSATELDRLVTVLMVNAVVASVYGLVQQVLGGARLAALGYPYNETIRTTGGHLRSFSTFEQPFPFAYYLMLVVLIGLPIAMSNPRRPRNRAFLFALPLFGAAVLFTFVRGAWLGLGAGFLYLMLRRYRKLLLLLPVLVLAVFYLPGSLTTSLFQSHSLGERSSGWTSNIGKVVAHPLGAGLGTTGAAAAVVAGANPATANPNSAAIVTASSSTYQPDNYYYKTIYELGVIGLWLFVLVLAFSMSTADRLAQRTRGPTSAFASGVAAFIVAAMAASLISTFFEIFPMDCFFWLMTGLIASIDHADERPFAFLPLST